MLINGQPGSSKTLSFKIVEENLRGKYSESPFYQTFKPIDIFVYQCSKYSTSKEIQSVFDSAVQRQKTFDERQQQANCVVFLDECGLPKKEKQPLKVLHYYLDDPKVSFVGITNEPFDNAKANRFFLIKTFLIKTN